MVICQLSIGYDFLVTITMLEAIRLLCRVCFLNKWTRKLQQKFDADSVVNNNRRLGNISANFSLNGNADTTGRNTSNSHAGNKKINP